MKLQELAVTSPTKQAAKIFESYFGNRVDFANMNRNQARNMLQRVRALVAEHRRNPDFHRSEQNPDYLKLVVMEQALSARIKEDIPPTSAPKTTSTQPQVNPQQQAALQFAQMAQKKRQLQDQSKQIDQQITELQKQKMQLQQQINNPAMSMTETRLSRRLREASEIQQAQVVLASQDMVDQVQKMIEQVTSMQFKDLPALVDQIKNEVGVDQASQFNGDASAALAGLTQNLQGSKQQLEQALGVVTGQATQIPGANLDVATDMGAELPPVGDEEIPAELPAPGEEEPGIKPASSTLGRGRR